jgi:hypothetical protein
MAKNKADENTMHPAALPIHRSRLRHPVPAGAVLPTSDNRGPWHEQLSATCVLPSQFFSSQTSLSMGRPVAALLQAVLEDALTCFQKQFASERRHVQRIAQEAEAWFLSEDAHSPFSFVSVCAVLGLEPEAIRQRLKHWSHSHPITPRRKMRRIAARQPHREIG